MQLYTCRVEPDRREPLLREWWSYSVLSAVAHKSTNSTRPATQSPKMSNSDPEAARKRIYPPCPRPRLDRRQGVPTDTEGDGGVSGKGGGIVRGWKPS